MVRKRGILLPLLLGKKKIVDLKKKEKKEEPQEWEGDEELFMTALKSG